MDKIQHIFLKENIKKQIFIVLLGTEFLNFITTLLWFQIKILLNLFKLRLILKFILVNLLCFSFNSVHTYSLGEGTHGTWMDRKVHGVFPAHVRCTVYRFQPPRGVARIYCWRGQFLIFKWQLLPTPLEPALGMPLHQTRIHSGSLTTRLTFLVRFFFLENLQTLSLRDSLRDISQL